MAVVKKSSRVAGGHLGMPPPLEEFPYTVAMGASDDKKVWKVPQFVDGKAIEYVFDKDKFMWSPGYTRDHILEQLEYKGEFAEKSAKVHEAFGAKLGKLNSTINKKKRDPEGLGELIRNFDTHCGELLTAYESVGFRGRDTTYAMMHLVVNLMKQKFKDRFEKIMHKQGNARELVTNFLVKEPFETQVESLKEATFAFSPTTSAAELGSFLISSQNGDIDLPSIHVRLSSMSASNRPAWERLAKWLGSGNSLYELQIVVDRAENEPGEVVALFNVLPKGFGVELLTLIGTTNIKSDGFYVPGQEKVATVILKALAASKNKEELLRINLTDCYVDADTMKYLGDLVDGSSITCLKLSKLRWGLNSTPNPFCTVTPGVRKLAPKEVLCFVCGLRRPKLCIGLCCACAVDQDKLRNDITAGERNFELQNGPLLHSSAAEGLCRVFKAMRGNGNVDLIDFSGTDLPALCGTAAATNAVLSAMAFAQPTAVVLSDAGLTDVHTHGIAQLFFMNSVLAHFEVTLASTDLEGVENLQNLAQNSPLIVSGGIYPGGQQEYTIAHPITFTEEKPKAYLCGIKFPDLPVPTPCCLKVQQVHVSQNLDTFKVPAKVHTMDDFQIFLDKVDGEIKEHLIVPLFTILAGLWKDNPKKMKNLQRAAADKSYKSVFSEEADKEKLELFADFAKDVALKASAADMFSFNKGKAVAGMSPEMLIEESVPEQQLMLTNCKDQAFNPAAAPIVELPNAVAAADKS